MSKWKRNSSPRRSSAASSAWLSASTDVDMSCASSMTSYGAHCRDSYKSLSRPISRGRSKFRLPDESAIEDISEDRAVSNPPKVQLVLVSEPLSEPVPAPKTLYFCT